MIAWLHQHWLLIVILFGLAVACGYLVYCAWRTGCAMYDDFFGPPA